MLGSASRGNWSNEPARSRPQEPAGLGCPQALGFRLPLGTESGTRRASSPGCQGPFLPWLTPKGVLAHVL